MKGVSEEDRDTDDSRGSIVNLVDESGSTVVSYTYTDYGETAERQDGSFDNEIRFINVQWCDTWTSIHASN